MQDFAPVSAVHRTVDPARTVYELRVLAEAAAVHEIVAPVVVKVSNPPATGPPTVTVVLLPVVG